MSQEVRRLEQLRKKARLILMAMRRRWIDLKDTPPRPENPGAEAVNKAVIGLSWPSGHIGRT